MEDKVTIDGNAHTMATLIAMVADSMAVRLNQIKPDLICSPEDYIKAIEESKSIGSDIILIDEVPHWRGFRLVPFSWQDYEP